MSYVVSGLPLEPFQALFGLSDEALAAHGVIRYAVDAPIGFPCRVTLDDAQARRDGPAAQLRAPAGRDPLPLEPRYLR